jgi:pimeloyl-ACP methyl ester carboxylesterase
MRNAIKFLILPTILISSCLPQPTTTTDHPAIALTDCVLKSPGIESQVDAKCGSLSVSEDPSDPGSRQIDLNIAVVEAIRRSPQPDPLFILVGGPGQSAIETYPALSGTVFRIHEERDIVLVDQRGTGESNPLRCLDPLDETLEGDEVVARLKECPARLDADLRFYTTDIAMQDLDRVRSALSYETINLYGVSYGTRAALVYLKMYPARVRSMILDAVVDPSFVLYQDAARDGQRALDLFFERCEADEACSSTYPGLRSEFEQMLQELRESPVDIIIAHPITGKPLDFTVTETALTNIIFNTLYSADLVAMLPLAIHQAYVEDNYAPLITQAYVLDAGIYDGMFYTVACAEDAPLLTGAEEEPGIFGSSVQNFIEVCEAWPQSEPPEVVHEPVKSGVPVLMLSGDADPITPPWHAEALTESLSNSLHLTFSGMGHGNGGSDCTTRIIDSFIESASTSGLDTTCVESIKPPPFFVDFSGPQP